MRLIDADTLIEAMKKTESEYENAMTCPSWWSAFNVISEQPTVYDIDKVVEELRRMSGNGYRDVDGDYVPPMIETKNAIEIVKKGIRKDISE